MPPNTVYVGRPTIWGNPFVPKHVINLMNPVPPDGLIPVDNCDDALIAFRRRLEQYPMLVADIKQRLRGKNLACWCPLNLPCHADILLEIANS